MAEVKEMPYSEKYAMVLDSMNLEDMFVPSFVQKHLGDQAVTELQRLWQLAVKPVPESASFEEKYELAYGNWIWKAKIIFSFIHGQLGADGMKQFEQADVEALKQKNAGPALLLLALVRALSPGLAFTMAAKKMAYQLQWLSSYSVSELTRGKLILDIPRCKILDFTDSDDICLIGCQRIYPTWLAQQFSIEMKAKREGNSCTLNFAPLR